VPQAGGRVIATAVGAGLVIDIDHAIAARSLRIDATTSLVEAFGEALERHGPDAKVIVLPYARYQLPANMVRMDADPLRFPHEALT